MAKPKKLMGVQQNQLHCDADTQAILTYLCEESNNLYVESIGRGKSSLRLIASSQNMTPSMQSVATFTLKRCPL